jgi:hypothetical protein
MFSSLYLSSSSSFFTIILHLGGGTPLCRHIREVTAKIREMEPMLRQQGQRAAIIIMTDGEASDGDLAAAMAPLQHLPVWVVVRLCTDEDKIVQYWNNIDEKLELDIDVLDDLLSEGAEVFAHNPWLNYNEPLHRMREFGVYFKEFDMIDEARLSLDQIRAVCCILFDVPLDTIPHPGLSFDSFVSKVHQLNSSHPKLYGLGHKRLLPPIDIPQLKWIYGQSCALM